MHGPLESLDQWEDFVQDRYNPKKEQDEFRQYTPEAPPVVQEFYRQNHTYQTRDFVHIKDVVDANMRVLESDDANFQAFNVGSGKPTTVLEYANLVGRKLSSELKINVSGEYRRGDNRNSVSKIDKLKMLGWNPKLDLSAILDDFLSWVESIGGIPIQIQDAYGDMRRAGVVLRATADSHV